MLQGIDDSNNSSVGANFLPSFPTIAVYHSTLIFAKL